MRIFVDFDKTICPDYTVDTEPMPNAVEVLNALKKAGHEIVIYSYRGNDESFDVKKEKTRMQLYLNTYGIPYDSFADGKPYFDVIIDDRAYNPQEIGWEGIADKLLWNYVNFVNVKNKIAFII